MRSVWSINQWDRTTDAQTPQPNEKKRLININLVGDILNRGGGAIENRLGELGSYINNNYYCFYLHHNYYCYYHYYHYHYHCRCHYHHNIIVINWREKNSYSWYLIVLILCFSCTSRNFDTSVLSHSRSTVSRKIPIFCCAHVVFFKIFCF